MKTGIEGRGDGDGNMLMAKTTIMFPLSEFFQAVELVQLRLRDALWLEIVLQEQSEALNDQAEWRYTD